MIKHKYSIAFVCIIFLSLSGAGQALEENYIKNIDISEADIIMDYQVFPVTAYLCVALKNNGDRKISNLSFEIKYYEEGDYLLKKVMVKNALNDDIPPGEIQKYKIRLNGDVVNLNNAQYPYDQSNKVDAFDIKITDVKLSSR